MSIETLWFKEALLPEGWAKKVRLSIQGGRIALVETDVEPATTDACHAVALPGLSNLHSHAFQRLMAGATEHRDERADSFWTWRTLMYTHLSQLRPSDIETIASMAFVEMLERGFTRVGEFHYIHNDMDGRAYANPAEMAERLASAACESGIGLTLLPVFYAHSGFGGRPPLAEQGRFIKTLDSFYDLLTKTRRVIGKLDDGVTGIAPHSLRAVTPEQLTQLIPMAEGGAIHIHIAEQADEVAACLDWSGQRPVDWLLSHADVKANWCLVHATHMTPSETDGLAGSGAIAGLCPITEANLGDGIFPAVDYLARRGAFGIGTDSNIGIDAPEELRWLEYGQRLLTRQRNVLAPSSSGAGLYIGALHGGARALGTVSGLSIGNSADLVSLDAQHASLMGKSGDLRLESYIFAAGSRAIDCVWRFGRKVVNGGQHVRREAVLRAYHRLLSRIYS